MKINLSVSEIFASIQGEGPTAGTPSIFLRLGGCNLLCGGKGTELDQKLHNGATWRCDTIEVWRKSTSYPIGDLINLLDSEFDLFKRMNNGWHLIITGGEPLMQMYAINELIQRISSKVDIPMQNIFNQIEIETNGTIEPMNYLKICHLNVSPKLFSSGEVFERRYKKEILEKICKLSKSFFKFVVDTDDDIKELETLFSFIPKEKIYLMPGASDKDTLQEKSIILTKKSMEMNVKFSSRLQVAIWDKTTGV